MELWLCCNCHRVSTLDKHGRCERCGSEAVITMEKIDDARRISQEVSGYRARLR